VSQRPDNISSDDVLFQQLAERCQPLGVAILSVSPADGSIERASGAIHRDTIEALGQCSSDQDVRSWMMRSSCVGDEVWKVSDAYTLVRLTERVVSRSSPMHYAIVPVVESTASESFEELHSSGSVPIVRCSDVGLVEHVRNLYNIVRRCETAQGEINSLGQELSETYEELNLLYRIGQKLNLAQEPSRFIQTVCREIHDVLPFRWVGVKLLTGSRVIRQLSGMFVTEGVVPCPSATAEECITTLLDRCALSSAMVIENTRREDIPGLQKLGHSLLLHPLHKEGEVYGAIVAFDKRGVDPDISTIDMKLLDATASHLQIYLENVTLYEQLHLMFLGTLEALTATIDAKDRYTCGHSQRVAMLSSQLARAVGLDESMIERIHIAGLVHDVGKIGVPEAVLCKTGRLTREEYAVIQRHPEIGAHILKDIPHFDDIIPGVMHHHERYDGKGYPHGLSGMDIPMFGRLITIADSFDAMSSTRTYRTAMPRDKVLAEIRQCTGTQFDPEYAAIFVDLDLEPYDGMVEQHKELGQSPYDLREDAA